MRKRVISRQKYKIRDIQALADYIKLVEECCSKDLVLFRGQRRDLPLKPKIARVTPRTGRLADERTMLDNLKREAIGLVNYVPETEWDWLALAQHHGMATRLLD